MYVARFPSKVHELSLETKNYVRRLCRSDSSLPLLSVPRRFSPLQLVLVWDPPESWEENGNILSTMLGVLCISTTITNDELPI